MNKQIENSEMQLIAEFEAHKIDHTPTICLEGDLREIVAEVKGDRSWQEATWFLIYLGFKTYKRAKCRKCACVKAKQNDVPTISTPF